MFFKVFMNNIINQIKTNSTYKSLILTFLIVLLIFLPLGIVLDKQYKKDLTASKREEIRSQLKDYSILLSRVINNKFSLLKALEVYTKENWDQEIEESDFNQFAFGIYSSNSGIRNLIIAPEGINKYVYPLKNNKEAVGHNLLKDKRPEVRKAVEETIDSKKAVASGPYQLRQGGQGIILRKAIYKNNNFWGLVTMALDMDPIYEYVKLKNKNSNINISLKQEKVFFGETRVFEKNPVNLILSYEGGNFNIAGIPNGGWNNSIKSDLKVFRIILCSIIFLLAIIIYILSYRNFKVQSLVETKTRYLKEINSVLQEKEKIIKKEKNKIEYLSLHDYMTGLYNRRHFENELKRLESSRKYPITIVIVDLDRLKVINDNYGHKMGDKYIINAAEILKSTARSEDIIARIGGDEFAIILPSTTHKEADKFCQRIQKNIYKFNKDENLVKPLSISMGFEVMEDSTQSLSEVFNKADQKMYRNKGRK
ncbi:MAG: diguanylate cyclase domain-containing protein [Bacillota bacterium]